jgi:hypothetical protein
MKKIALIFGTLCLASAVFAGFKVKNVKPKRPEQFQSRITIEGVTFAADLLLSGDDQKEYFYKELTPYHFIAVRLAVFNNGDDEVVLPLSTLELIAPDGKNTLIAGPDVVAQTILGETSAAAQSKREMPQVGVGAGGSIDPRRDPTSPGYDPRLDPNDPRYDPGDPRNTGQYPPGTYPPGTTPGTYPGGVTMRRPGIILNPGGGGNLTKFEIELAEKDFRDKAHTKDPVLSSMRRDRFLYFPIITPPAAAKGYTLRLPVSKGIPQEVVLKF